MTEEQLDAKKWQMFEEGKALKRRRDALEDEIKKFVTSWTTMAQVFSLPHNQTFLISDREIELSNPLHPTKRSDAIPWRHFDAEAIKLLLGDFQRTREEFEQENKLLKPHGIDLGREDI